MTHLKSFNEMFDYTQDVQDQIENILNDARDEGIQMSTRAYPYSYHRDTPVDSGKYETEIKMVPSDNMSVNKVSSIVQQMIDRFESIGIYYKCKVKHKIKRSVIGKIFSFNTDNKEEFEKINWSNVRSIDWIDLIIVSYYQDQDYNFHYKSKEIHT